jgi:hypothetical protein
MDAVKIGLPPKTLAARKSEIANHQCDGLGDGQECTPYVQAP